MASDDEGDAFEHPSDTRTDFYTELMSRHSGAETPESQLVGVGASPGSGRFPYCPAVSGAGFRWRHRD
eukprot:8479326-Pyramimonas_sp.AAC.1